MTSYKRLFFAVWPDELTRKKCLNLAKRIDKPGLQLVSPTNLHVTLVFLGSVSTEQEARIRQAAGKIAIPRITLNFNQLSYWKKPGILCLTATTVGVEVIQLAKDLTELAKHHNISVDPRPYKPHVTLARHVADANVLEFTPIHWTSKSFCLVESRFVNNHSEYHIIESWG